MARAPDERVVEALKLYKQGLKLIEIASRLKIPEGTVRSWKNRYDWDNATLQKNKRNVAKGKGGQPDNKNAVGHGAPSKNDNAVKHGLFEKYLPQETLDIVNSMSLNPLDILWDQIQIAYAAIVRAQQIMHVKDKDDLTKELKRSRVKTSNRKTEKTKTDSSDEEYEYELQFAWDKQANFLKAQARAQSELRSMIKQYDELLHNNWELATEEQKARIEVMKARANIGGNEPTKDDGFLEALSGKVDAIWSEE